MNRTTKKFQHYKTVSAPSAYVGTMQKRQLVEMFGAVMENVFDEFSVQIYGERTRNMIKLTVTEKTDISDGDIIAKEGSGVMYKVVSVMQYSDHTVITAERE